MLRGVAILGVAIAVLQVAASGAAQAVPAAAPRIHLTAARGYLSAAKVHRAGHRRIRAEAAHSTTAAPRVSQAAAGTSPGASPDAPLSLAYQLSPAAAATPPAPALEVPPTLTYQEREVSRMAGENGDRDFLMVDKALGKIILFENGQAIFGAAALTGASMGDRLPPGALTEDFASLNTLDTKVTPAGRYTVVRNYVKEYGTLFDVKEIRGKDWGIAIHQVYLGIPSEHREARLESPSVEVKHITFGCINVAPETLQVLLRELPQASPTPLYILPEDKTKTAEYFAARTS